jgi:hypothetical protein
MHENEINAAVLEKIADALLREFEADRLYEANWHVTFSVN